MTANQVAYQANLIQDKNFTAQREETKRHNQEMERIEDDRNAIQSTLGAMADQRAKEELAYKKEVEAKLRERQVADQERRTDIDWTLAALKETEETRLRWYNEETIKLQQRDHDLQVKKYDLEKDFQEFQKSKAWTELGLRADEIAIQAKNVDYQHWDRVESNIVARDSYVSQRDLGWANLLWARESLNRSLTNQFQIANLNYDINQRDLQLKQEQWNTMRKLYNAQTFNYIISPIIGRGGIMDAATNTIKMFATTDPVVKAAKLLFK